MNSNFGLLEPLAERVRDKRARREKLAERALSDLLAWAEALRADAMEPVAVGS
jgi:folate-dependent tRNA-U54 methylase TrmFO/GidA